MNGDRDIKMLPPLPPEPRGLRERIKCAIGFTPPAAWHVHPFHMRPAGVQESETRRSLGPMVGPWGRA